MRILPVLAAAGLMAANAGTALAWGCNGSGYGSVCNVSTHSKSYVEYHCPAGTTPVSHGGHTICKAPAKKTVVTRTYTTKTYVSERRSHSYVDHYSGGHGYGHGHKTYGHKSYGHGYTHVNSGFGTPFYGQ